MGQATQIKLSDLNKLMRVVDRAVGLYNAIEHMEYQLGDFPEWDELGDALRDLGLHEAHG